MPNGHLQGIEYGGHKYDDDSESSNCQYKCGCWMSPARSSGPAGIDPFGECPRNPLSGKSISVTHESPKPNWDVDKDYIIHRRMHKMKKKIYELEERCKSVDVDLHEENKKLKNKLGNLVSFFYDLPHKVERLLEKS